ncbi:MAG: zinc dependent phospholipase C family protein [Bacteroidia bacterium]|nr:zinc dependent phospholipase C family protein [Bacteroidia bacterium]
MKYCWLFLSLWICSASTSVYGWGFWAHPRINRLAVYTLPPEMLPFFKANIEFISLHAVKPDERRYAVDGEAPKHYIDLDHYGKLPFSNFPKKWQDATQKYSEDTILAYGTVPWTIQQEYRRLIQAFKDKNADAILRISSELGHYIADAHVPLHTTENYNGQFSGQYGIHGFWESRLPELFANNYDFFLGPAYMVEDPLAEAWKAVLESHTALDSVFQFEKDLTQKSSEDLKYSFETRNNANMKVYSVPFSKMYHAMLGGQVERRMRMAILRVGSFWYSAWLQAGQPDLNSLIDPSRKLQEDNYEKKLKILDREAARLWKNERWAGCCATSLNHSCHRNALKPERKWANILKKTFTD